MSDYILNGTYEIPPVTAGGYWCQKCGEYVSYGVYHYCTTTQNWPVYCDGETKVLLKEINERLKRLEKLLNR